MKLTALADVEREFDRLPTKYVKGRNRTGERTVPAAFDDVEAPDREGDVILADDYFYFLVNDSGTLKWARFAVDVAW